MSGVWKCQFDFVDDVADAVRHVGNQESHQVLLSSCDIGIVMLYTCRTWILNCASQGGLAILLILSHTNKLLAIQMTTLIFTCDGQGETPPGIRKWYFF